MVRYVLIFSTLLISIPAVVSAAIFQNPLEIKMIQDVIKGLIKVVIYVGTPVFVVAMTWSGFLFVAAQGNPQKISDAKNTFIYVLLAGFILLSLWAATTLIGNTLAGFSAAALLIILLGFFLYFIFKK